MTAHQGRGGGRAGGALGSLKGRLPTPKLSRLCLGCSSRGAQCWHRVRWPEAASLCSRTRALGGSPTMGGGKRDLQGSSGIRVPTRPLATWANLSKSQYLPASVSPAAKCLPCRSVNCSEERIRKCSCKCFVNCPGEWDNHINYLLTIIKYQ